MLMPKQTSICTLLVSFGLVVLLIVLGATSVLERAPGPLPSFIENLQQKVNMAKEPKRSGKDVSVFDRVTDTDEDFMQSQRQVQTERRETLASGCQKYRYARSRYNVVKKPPWNIIVDHEHRLMFCFIPKVACTSWKRVFLVLKGAINETDAVSQFDVNHRLQKKLNFFSRQPRAKREFILEHYAKFMIARDPLSRVLSAYKNKLAPDTTFTRAQRWQRDLGQEIVDHFHKRSDDVDETAYRLTFEDFVRFLVAEESMPKQDDRHWMEMHRMCLPCDISYDVIGKFETMATDSEYILRSNGLSDRIKFPTSDGSSPTNSSEQLQQYYRQLPVSLVQSLYQRYSLDFELFGYSPLDFITDGGIT